MCCNAIGKCEVRFSLFVHIEAVNRFTVIRYFLNVFNLEVSASQAYLVRVFNSTFIVDGVPAETIQGEVTSEAFSTDDYRFISSIRNVDNRSDTHRGKKSFHLIN